MAVATLTLRTDELDPEPIVLNFLAALTEEGYPLDQLVNQEEELTTPGVTGKRWRTVFQQYKPVAVQTVADQSSHVNAVNDAQKYERAVGRWGKLVVTTGAARTVALTVHVSAVRARVSPGPTVGSGATNGSAATIFADWVFEVLE